MFKFCQKNKRKNLLTSSLNDRRNIIEMTLQKCVATYLILEYSDSNKAAVRYHNENSTFWRET